MEWIELVNVEHGDCTVLGGKNSILMVDCGSVNHKIKSLDIPIKNVFDFIYNRYSLFENKQFILTHYHRDHICGFWHILNKNCNYFDKIHIPYIPLHIDNSSPLLEFALYSKAFQIFQTDIFQNNTSFLTIFKNLGKKIGYENISIIAENQEFNFDNKKYKILNPPKILEYNTDFVNIVNDLNNIVLTTGIIGDNLIYLIETFITIYYECLEKNNIQENSEKLEDILFKIGNLDLSSIKDDILEILENRTTKELYSSTMNNISIIFHNSQTCDCDILMTGDSQHCVFERIYNNLYDNYYIIKAPHHGTKSGYSKIIKDLQPFHLLINNGKHNDYTIFESYYSMESIKHCTNNSNCTYYAQSKACCNRLNYCYDLSNDGNLCIACHMNKKLTYTNDCKIYVVTPTQGRSCFCD